MSVESFYKKLSALLADSQITDVCVNGPEIFADSGNGLSRIDVDPIHDEALREWALELLSSCGKTWDAKHPFVDGVTPSGHRIHVVFPPISRQILVSFRKTARRANTQPPEARWGSSPLFETAGAWVREGRNILISGATGSGKTTLMNDLLASCPSMERVVALEDTPELAPQHPHFVSLCSRPPNADGFGEVTPRALLRQALRMRPDRIILGECRGPEILDWLQALNTGHRGALATLHANSAREALQRTELLALLGAQGQLDSRSVRQAIAAGLEGLVHVRRIGGQRMISEAWTVAGREGDTILLRPVVMT